MTKKTLRELRAGFTKARNWPNLSRSVERHNVTVSRRYRNEVGWKEPCRFGRNDLLTHQMVADLFHSRIFRESKGPTGEARRNERSSSQPTIGANE